MQINPLDNVEVVLETGHKSALRHISKGENVMKYGFPIGHALCDISKGEHVHTHNLATNLGEQLTYAYNPQLTSASIVSDIPTFMGYRRENGLVGIRNEIWIIVTVGCVNKTAELLAKKTGAEHFPHPFGCSQMGDDQEITQKTLAGLVKHPNCGGVLVLGLGCENNNIEVFKKYIKGYNPNRVKFLNVQDCEDEILEGTKIIEQLKEYASCFSREPIPVSELKVGLKCGGSDGYSGITANPLVGSFSDILIGLGGTTVLTEVPEMFGAETLLMNRCINNDIFSRTVSLINDYKEYFEAHNQVVYENPSPGNKAGGITTLEEKSLGCVQKGGSANVVDVLTYGDTLKAPGLNLLNGPGNDIVAITNLTAAGAHLIIFTTGRGTPVGAPVPTVKVSTNTALYNKKKHWIDFDAGGLLNGTVTPDDLFKYIVSVAEGRQTNNEKYSYKEISIFKDGVTL